jgi:hypothetical protein
MSKPSLLWLAQDHKNGRWLYARTPKGVYFIRPRSAEKRRGQPLKVCYTTLTDDGYIDEGYIIEVEVDIETESEAKQIAESDYLDDRSR